MNDEERKIIITRISEFHQDGSGNYQHKPVSPVNRWLSYAILIPIIALMAVLGVFFFAAFLALLAVAIVVIGIRFWWLRRKFENTAQPPDSSTRQADRDSTIIIEDAQIIEESSTHRAKQKE